MLSTNQESIHDLHAKATTLSGAERGDQLIPLLHIAAQSRLNVSDGTHCSPARVRVTVLLPIFACLLGMPSKAIPSPASRLSQPGLAFCEPVTHMWTIRYCSSLACHAVDKNRGICWHAVDKKTGATITLKALKTC